jgi:copper oxidase (laccase) domain-containing protein
VLSINKQFFIDFIRRCVRVCACASLINNNNNRKKKELKMSFGPATLPPINEVDPDQLKEFSKEELQEYLEYFSECV